MILGDEAQETSYHILLLLQNEVTKCFQRADQKLKELIDTELSYAKVLDSIVELYIPYMKEGKNQTREKGVVAMPSELAAGRDTIAMGNIIDIHTFQKKYVQEQANICVCTVKLYYHCERRHA